MQGSEAIKIQTLTIPTAIAAQFTQAWTDFTYGYCGKRSECNNNNMISVKSSSIVHIHIYSMAVMHNVISFLNKLYTNSPSALSVGIYLAVIYQQLLTKSYKHKYLAATELTREGNKRILKGCVLGF